VRILRNLALLFTALLLYVAGMLFLYPRPADTTDPAVFAGDGAQLDYCDLPTLYGGGLTAADIPKAFTPGCGWQRWPLPILAACTEPLAPGVVDLRGLWRSVTEGVDHVERIEQCGNRTVITAAGIIHDFLTDGTLSNGSRDIEPPGCMNTWASIDWREDVMHFHPFGLPYTIVTREMQQDQLVWHYPRLGEVRMERICRIPEEHRHRPG